MPETTAPAPISSFTIHAAAGVGEFERVRYARGTLTYERGGLRTPPHKVKVRLKGSGFDALCESIRDSHIEFWPVWNPALPEPLGRSFPQIKIAFRNGVVLRWRNRGVPRSEAWRQAEAEISRALGVEFSIEGGAYLPRPTPAAPATNMRRERYHGR